MTGERARPIGLGCMRLSTEPGRDRARGLAVLAAALAAGVDLLDTADAYGLDAEDAGHNEALIASALAARAAADPAAPPVTVVTKGGLVRPGGAWVPDGRAAHLAAAARASRRRLGVAALDLYLLHAVDPRTPLATSVRALARLRDDGVARAIGLANVGPYQLEQALALTRLDAVEVELSPWQVAAVRGGLLSLCERHGLLLLAHRPLGGDKGRDRLERDPVVGKLAAACGASPAELALAWLRQLSPAIVTLPGPTQLSRADSAPRAARLRLDAATVEALDQRFLDPARPERARGRAAASGLPPTGPSGPPAEVLLIMGMPGAGKTTLAERFVAEGYARLNRDQRGGSLGQLAADLDQLLDSHRGPVVLDNTYPTRAARADVLRAAARHGRPCRCMLVDTPLPEAQARAARRAIAILGRLPEAADFGRGGPGVIGPGAQFRYARQLEPPSLDEGFDQLEVVTATPPPAPTTAPGATVAAALRPALIVELDELLWRGRPRRPAELELPDLPSLPELPSLIEQLRAAAAEGALLAGTAWQPDPAARPDELAALDAALAERLGAPLVVLRCRHPPGPPQCWCRKPLPGLALLLAREHGVDLARSLHLGRGAADRGFAERAGVPYREAVPLRPRRARRRSP